MVIALRRQSPWASNPPATRAGLGQYTYDAAGRRVRKIAGGVTTLYFYDSAGHLIESQNLSTTPATRRSYVFAEDEPVGVVDQPPSGSPAFSWIHTDRLGTPLAATNTPSSGPAKTIWRASYEPYGLATPDEDPDGDSQTFTLDLRFPGQVFDGESGEHYNFYRTYDSADGRYLEPDPLSLSGDLNLFQYARANPLGHTDRAGLSPWSYAREFARYAMLNTQNTGLPGGHNGPADAYRHCLWSCLVSRELGGPQIADLYATAHEVIDNTLAPAYRRRAPQPQSEFQMDMFNNLRGRVVDLRCRPEGKSCEQGCREALAEGNLFYLETPLVGWPPTAPRAYHQAGARGPRP